MPLIVKTRNNNFILNKLQSAKLFQSQNKSLKNLSNQIKKSKSINQQKLQSSNIESQKTSLSKNKSSKNSQGTTSLSKISEKNRNVSRLSSKRLFQKAKQIQDPNIQTYLVKNTIQKKDKSIKKNNSTNHLLPPIKNKYTDYSKYCKTITNPFANKSNDKINKSNDKINKSNDKINKENICLQSASQESICFQARCQNMHKNLIKPLKKQMIETIKMKNNNNLTESEIIIYRDLEENLFREKVNQNKKIKRQNKQDQILSQLSKLILQGPIAQNSIFQNLRDETLSELSKLILQGPMELENSLYQTKRDQTLSELSKLILQGPIHAQNIISKTKRNNTLSQLSKLILQEPGLNQSRNEQAMTQDTLSQLSKLILQGPTYVCDNQINCLNKFSKSR